MITTLCIIGGASCAKLGNKKLKKGKEKKRAKALDELQLRRDLREQTRMTESKDLAQEGEMPALAGTKCSEDIRIGGIEGGGTHSTLVILDGKGALLTRVEGPDTNHWSIGIDEAVARLSAMIEKGKQQLGIAESVPLECVGLCLSGCEEESSNNVLVQTLLKNYSNSAKDYVIGSDTIGSLRTGLETGGIVLIAGTGSNGLLINPDGKTHRCGGWGYMIGDEGGAYWIAHRACKYVFDDFDGLKEAPAPTNYMWSAMKSYFKANDRNSILPYLYANFDKSTIASFTKEIVAGCERDDSLCLKLFEEAGQILAKHVIALSKKAHNDLKLAKGGLKVICVGSVWKSWKFMKEGFLDEIQKNSVMNELTLLRLTTTSALGASYLAAEKINCPFVKPYDKNVEICFHYERDPEKQIESETCGKVENKTITCVHENKQVT